MKEFNILSENYLKGTRLVRKATDEISGTIQENIDTIDKLLDEVFLNEDIDNESPEYFTLKSNALVKQLLKEDYTKELAVISSNSKELKLPIAKAVKCAYCIDELEHPEVHDTTAIDKVNGLFGDSCDINSVDIPECCVENNEDDKKLFRKKIANLEDEASKAKSSAVEAIKTIGKFDKEPLKESLKKLVYIKGFIDEYNR